MRNINNDALFFHFLHGKLTERRKAELIAGHDAAADLIAAVPCERHNTHAVFAQVVNILEIAGNGRAALYGQNKRRALFVAELFEVFPGLEHGERARLGHFAEIGRMAIKILQSRSAAHRIGQPHGGALHIRRKAVTLLYADVQVIVDQRFVLVKTRYKRVAVQVKIAHEKHPFVIFRL